MPDLLTDQHLAEIEARCAAATPGPWRVDETGHDVIDATHSIADCGPQRDYSYGMKSSCANAEFIAHSRTDVPRLVDEVRRLLGAPNVGVREAASTLGRPDAKIVDAAKEAGAGMIVMGAFGRSRIHEYFLGSNSAAVVRSSPIAVLLAR